MYLAPESVPNSSSTPRRGFTLLEIMVSITIVAILAGLVVPMVFQHVGDAKRAAAAADIEAIGLALDSYALAVGRYPTTEQGLAALVTRPAAEPEGSRWRGPYLKRGVPRDPWGNDYQYASPGAANPTAYDLASYGRDGRAGGVGEDADIRSWERTLR